MTPPPRSAAGGDLAYRPTTHLLYGAVERCYRAWAAAREADAEAAATALAWLDELRDRGLAQMTLGSYAGVVIRRVCPTAREGVRDRLLAWQRQAGRDEREGRLSDAPRPPEPRRPLRKSMLRDLLAAQPATVQGVRAKAMLAVAWYGLLRCSDLRMIRYESCAWEPDGITIRLVGAKTDRHYRGQFVGLRHRSNPQHDPVILLDEWLRCSGIREGFLFRRILKTGNVHPSAPLSYSGVARIFREAFALVPGAARSRFATHSLRRGAATELAMSGASTIAIMQAGRWKSVQMAHHYVESAPLANDPFAAIDDA